MKQLKPARYTRQFDILVNAIVNDSREVMCIDQLAPEIQLHIVTGRLMGFHPISVRWPTGEFALMFCEFGTNMPDPRKVIEAYQHCLATNQTYPAGVCK